jgi:hypothetical protein
LQDLPHELTVEQAQSPACQPLVADMVTQGGTGASTGTVGSWALSEGRNWPLCCRHRQHALVGMLPPEGLSCRTRLGARADQLQQLLRCGVQGWQRVHQAT